MRTLIVGLGNPGRLYSGTRHNVGSDFISYLRNELSSISATVSDPAVSDCHCLSSLYRVPFNHLYTDKPKGIKKKRTIDSVTLEATPADIILSTPRSLMNVCGLDVRNAISHHRPDHILLIHDDLEIPVGKFKLKLKGSAGGHNGIKSIQDVMKRDDLPRIRIGIDRPVGKSFAHVSRHVLSHFRDDELMIIKSQVFPELMRLLFPYIYN
eukprot:Partr_v1_DN23635_c0_g1_i1_m19130 putative Peptidyl-trna hydrolase